jgi:hypothetical protein
MHLGSFKNDEAGVIERIKAEEVFFFRQRKKMGLWIDFFHTELSGRVMEEFGRFVLHAGEYISRLAMARVPFVSRLKFSKCLKGNSIPIRYYSDPEEAKSWLVADL